MLHLLHVTLAFVVYHHGSHDAAYRATAARTAAVVGAYLLSSGRCRTVDEVVALLRAARPSIIIRPEAMGALRSYQLRLAGSCAV